MIIKTDDLKNIIIEILSINEIATLKVSVLKNLSRYLDINNPNIILYDYVSNPNSINLTKNRDINTKLIYKTKKYRLVSENSIETLYLPILTNNKSTGALILESNNKDNFNTTVINSLLYLCDTIGLSYSTIQTKTNKNTKLENNIGIVKIDNDIQFPDLFEPDVNSKERDKLLSDSTSEAIFVSRNGTCIDLNKSAENIFGYTKDEAIGKFGTDWIHPDYRNIVITNFSSGTNKPYDIVAIRKNGTTFPCEMQGKTLTINGDEIRITTIRDITRTKNVEIALQKAKEKFNIILQSVVDVIYTANKKGDITYINNSVKKTFGFEPEEIIGQNIKKFIHHKEDKKNIDILSEHTNITYKVFLKLRCKNGSFIDTEINRSLIIINGKKVIIGCVRDITYWKESERIIKLKDKKLEERSRRLDMALIGSNAGIWDWDIKTDHVYFSRQWCAIIGYKHSEIEQNIQSWGKLVHPDDMEFIDKALKKHLAGETSIYQTEHRMKSKTGEWRWVVDTGRVTERDSLGSPVRIVGTHIDITDKKINEIELKQNLRNQGLLSQVALELSTTKNFDKSINSSLKKIGSVIDISKIYIFIKSDDKLSTSIKFEWTNKNTKLTEVEDPIYYYKKLNSWKNKTNKESIIDNNNINILPDEISKIITLINLKAHASFPLYIKEDIIGFIGFDERVKPRIWSKSDIEFLKTVSRLISNAYGRKQYEFSTNENMKNQELLSEISLELNYLLYFEDSINSTLKKIGERLNTSKVYIYETDKDAGIITNTFEWCNKGIKSQISHYKNYKSKDTKSWLKEELTINEQIIYSEETKRVHPYLKNILLKEGIKALASYPLIVNNEYFGRIGIDEIGKKRRWTKSEIELLKTISGIISNAFERRQNEYNINQNIKNQELLSEISLELNSLSNFNEIINSILRKVGLRLDVSKVYICEEDIDGECLSNTFEWNNKNSVTQNLKSRGSLTGLGEELSSDNRIIYLEETENIPENLKKILNKNKTKSSVSYPLIVDNKHFGRVGVNEIRKERRWTKSEIELLKTISGIISNAYQRKQNEYNINQNIKNQELVSKIALELNSLSNFEHSMNQILKSIGTLINVSRVYIFEDLKDGFSTSNTYEWCNSNINSLKKRYEEINYKIYPFLKELTLKESIIHFNTLEDFSDETIKFMKEYEISARISFPIYIKGKKTGYIGLNEYKTERVWGKSEIELIRTISGILSSAYERRVMEQTVIKERDKAEFASKAKAQFLSSMSHEIRTPLNAINGFVNLLEYTELTKKQKSYTDGLNTTIGSLLSIINDILDFSKIESGELTLEKAPFDIFELMDEIINTMQYKAEESGLSLTLDIDKKISSMLLGDKVRIRQIILNLVSNSIKFTKTGSVNIITKLKESTDKTNLITFEVIDTGIGIDKKNHKTIFSSFKQEDSSTTRKYGGTGLGLSISSEFAKLMESSIQIDSVKGEGAKFYFSVLFDIIKHHKKITEKKIEIIPEALRGVKILLVDDNQFNLLIAKSIIEKWNTIIETAENGQIAIDKIKLNSYDIILMDLQMPILGGIDATEIIRKDLKLDIPIIALTADIIKGVIDKCTDVGMNDYISKPFDPKVLFGKIIKLLKIDISKFEIPK